MIRAVAGCGGRGMRMVTDIAELASAWERCQSEALAAFGNVDLLVEELASERAMPRSRSSTTAPER